MTRNRDRGENDITREADKEAARTGKPICQILAEMLRRARLAGDLPRVARIIKAQKYRGCRNIRERRNQK